MALKISLNASFDNMYNWTDTGNCSLGSGKENAKHIFLRNEKISEG
jgi:hypothetical protein